MLVSYTQVFESLFPELVAMHTYVVTESESLSDVVHCRFGDTSCVSSSVESQCAAASCISIPVGTFGRVFSVFTGVLFSAVPCNPYSSSGVTSHIHSSLVPTFAEPIVCVVNPVTTLSLYHLNVVVPSESESVYVKS